MEKTKNFLQIENLPFIGVKEYLIPDTQRDAVKLNTTGGATVNEFHNHCKPTSCTMAWNSLGKIYSDKYPILSTMITMGEYQYQNILMTYMTKDEKIQDWLPHVRMFNDLFDKNKIPLVAKFGKFRANESKVMDSMKKGLPVVLGTMVTNSGHIVLLYRIVEINGVKHYIWIDPYGNPLTTPKYKITTADYYSIPKSKFNEWINSDCNCIWFEEK